MSSQFVRFLATGGTAALVNLASRSLLNQILSFELSVAIAYLIGMVTAYLLSRMFVFENSGCSVASEFNRFAIVNFFSLAVVWLVSVGLAKLLFPAIGYTWHADNVAHVIGLIAPVGVSYLGHRHFSFAKSLQK